MSPIIQADFSYSDWQFTKSIGAPEPGNTGYIRVPLDGEVYGRSQAGLADLRVINTQGNEVPYALLEERSQTTIEEYAPRIFNRAVVPRAYSTLTLDLERQVYHNTLVLRTSSENFKRQVEISGSPDGKAWLILKKNGYIFDFSGEQKIQLTRITYPESNYRYLQVKIWDGREPPLNLKGVSISFEKTVNPARKVRSHRLISRQEDPRLKATVLVLDLNYVNLPWDFLTLETPEENYARLVEIQGSNDAREWQRHLQSDYYHFHTAKYDLEKKTFQFPEAHQRYAKVIVFNYDDRALRLEGIEVQGVEKELILRSQPDTVYRLYYGNPFAVPPRYDIDRVKNYLNLDSLPKLTLGAESANQEYRIRRRAGPWTESHPVIYWGALILLVLSLGAYILRLLAKTKPDG